MNEFANISETIKKAQEHNELAENELFYSIKNHPSYKQLIAKYGRWNAYPKDFSNDDIESAFWLGVVCGLKVVNPESPRAFIFLISSGEFYIRREIWYYRKNERFLECPICFSIQQARGKQNEILCKTCNIPMKEYSYTIPTDFSMMELEGKDPQISEHAHINLLLEDFQKILSDRERILFALLLEDDATREKVAKKLKISRQYVEKILFNIQEKLAEFVTNGQSA